ncbi:A/G-specific adenine glycosylase [Rhodopila sp.]|uniref:A/G-specific adenine glycosylase n=1 Tax=Rhodopila sp. TaxID=2480087 RepID=UPI003D0D8B7D
MRVSSSAIASSAPVARAGDLLRWYDRHRRRLPWRADPGEAADPYRVWLSEVMLQQTTVTAVIPYYERFVSRFPTIQSLAAAPLDTVMSAWAGLGYYARARNLHACANVVTTRGGFPADLAGLQALPGIGAYTAAAIGAIAFGIPTVPVDGNVERVAARIFAIDQPMPAAKTAIRQAAAHLGADPAAQARPSDFAQAMFDLGASVCAPAAPACAVCPWIAACAACRQGTQTLLPRKTPKKPRPVRYGVHFWLTDNRRNVLLRTRPRKGLLGGMTELPGTAWREAPWTLDEALTLAPMPLNWRPAGQVRHGFTHFELIIDILAAQTAKIDAEGFAHALDALDDAALPSVMRKCVRMASG